MKLKIKFKIEFKSVAKYLYFAAIFLFFLSLSLVIYFLYQNFYQTILGSEEILILKQQIAPESFDIEKFNQIIEKMEAKQEEKETDWNKIGNIFKRGQRPQTPPANNSVTTTPE